jgi:tetratricopeptide (TPR) repeat protein
MSTTMTLSPIGKLCRSSLAAVLLGVTSVPVCALDLVHRRSNEKTVGGDITKVSRTEVIVTQKVGNKEEVIPANDISYIEWDGEPGPLKLARGSENTGNLDESIKQYQEAVKEVSGGKDGLKSEVDFGLARALARRALRTPAELPAAITQLKSFINGNRDHYRFYDAQLLLGDALLASKDDLTAEVSFKSVSEASWPDYQMAGKLGLGRSAIARNDVPKAKALFDEVAAVDAKTPAETSRKLEGLLGQARCLQAGSDYEGALKILEQVIDQATAADSRIQAEAYLRQGDVYRLSKADPRKSVIAYLHVDVIPDFAAENDLHAESLYRLAKLWPAAGDAGRGAEAASRLQAEFPESEWTKKLSEPETN